MGREGVGLPLYPRAWHGSWHGRARWCPQIPGRSQSASVLPVPSSLQSQSIKAQHGGGGPRRPGNPREEGSQRPGRAQPAENRSGCLPLPSRDPASNPLPRQTKVSPVPAGEGEGAFLVSDIIRDLQLPRRPGPHPAGPAPCARAPDATARTKLAPAAARAPRGLHAGFGPRRLGDRGWPGPGSPGLLPAAAEAPPASRLLARRGRGSPAGLTPSRPPPPPLHAAAARSAPRAPPSSLLLLLPAPSPQAPPALRPAAGAARPGAARGSPKAGSRGALPRTGAERRSRAAPGPRPAPTSSERGCARGARSGRGSGAARSVRGRRAAGGERPGAEAGAGPARCDRRWGFSASTRILPRLSRPIRCCSATT